MIAWRLLLLALACASGPLAAGLPEPTVEAATSSSLRAEDLRVAAIAYKMAIAGASLCPEPYPVTGLLLHHLPEYDAAGREQMIAGFSLDRGPGVLAVVADSPAARSGLAAGDVLLGVNGHPFPPPRSMAAMRERSDWRKAIAESEMLLESELRKGPATIDLLRGGEELQLPLDSVSGCPARARLARSSQTNAFADGAYVVVTTALLDFVADDDELAVAIGHELAHNVLGHRARLEREGVPDGLLRGIGRNAARVRVTEEEADRLGLALAAAAGFDVDAAIPFWRRYYARFDRAPQLFRTHPGLKAREKLIEEALAERR